MKRHAVFDWNGTLFDDIGLVLRCDSAVGDRLQLWPAVTLDFYRRNSSRDWRRYYSRLAGVEITEAQARQIDLLWHEYYVDHRHEYTLFADAMIVLSKLQSHGISCSILSMHPHKELMALIERFSLEPYFTAIAGRHAFEGGKSKTERLKLHLEQLRAQGFDDFVMIGDNVDDGLAARHAGISAMMVSTGEQNAERLQEASWPVFDSLSDACDSWLSLAGCGAR